MTTEHLPLVVCGLHRSGTTYVGELIKASGVIVVHEPLNEQFGMADVPIAYPYTENVSDVFAPLIDAAISFTRPWNKDTTNINKGFVGRKIFSFTGGKSGLLWGGIRLMRLMHLPTGQICLKDPFLSLSTPYMVRKLGLRTICMVRHPAAIHYSTVRQNWRFDVDNLLRQQCLISSYGADIPDEHWEMARESAAASIAILWKIMVRINIDVANEDHNLLLITHESLCLEPHVTARKILGHYKIPYTREIEQFVSEHSNGERVESKDGKIHDFTRNSREIPALWRQKIDPHDNQIISVIAREELNLVYGQE